MKKEKILRDVGVLLIVVALVFSTAVVTADTVNENAVCVTSTPTSSPQPNPLIFSSASSAILWDQYDTDGSNGFSHMDLVTTGYQRDLLDDFEIPVGETWFLEDFHSLNLWDTLTPPQGEDFHLEFWSDAGGSPGVSLVTAVTVSYVETATGRIWFDRPEFEIEYIYEPITLTEGVYWIYGHVVGPENCFWMAKQDVIWGSECWTDYGDTPPMGPGSVIFGEPYDISFKLSGTSQSVQKDFRYTNVNWDRHLIFSEDFSTCPMDWTEDPAHEDNWYCSATSFAGGTPNEYVFWWDVLPYFTDHTWFMSPPINTVGMSAVEMSYKQKVVHYDNSYFLGVEASPDGTSWYTAFEQEYSANSGPETITLMLPDEAINSPTTYVRFFFDGYSDDITYWDIDDIEIYANANLGDLLPISTYMDPLPLYEDFEGSWPPTGWTIHNPGDHTWNTNVYWSRTNYAGSGQCADADSDHAPASDNMAGELWTPSFNLVTKSSATLEFNAAYNFGGYSPGGEYFAVDVSDDGGSTWTNEIYWQEDHSAIGPGEHVIVDLTPYCGSSNVIIRFVYDDLGAWDWWCEVDDVTIYAVGEEYEYYDVDVVVHEKTGKVKSTNPGQLYGVISITGEVSEVAIMDTFDMEFDVNPAHLGGGVEIIMVDPDGIATILTDGTGISADVYNDANEVEILIDLIEATGDPLPPGWTLMVYIKFKTAMKHELWGPPFDEYFFNIAEVYVDDIDMTGDPLFTVNAQIYLTEAKGG